MTELGALLNFNILHESILGCETMNLNHINHLYSGSLIIAHIVIPSPPSTRSPLLSVCPFPIVTISTTRKPK
jgi:hypothetical protein